ncbi:MAG: 5-formyltetrahydrofolate cyclo-ligase [Gammaproteobacteria bacterium]|nr:MAG: 5-formyltetrahydrofolate cyclo-ligase [Gammaproteobacteria bacterium]
MTDKPSRNALRQQIRQQRRDLDFSQQQHHARSLCRLLTRLPLFLNARRIACYLTEDGEIDAQPVIEKAWQYKKQVYLPVLPPTGKSLVFAPFTADTPMVPNRFGILEPDTHPNHWIRARQLNLILLPLVAFDPQGNRLGMGGGYYDRSLSFMQHRKQWHSPKLVGLAHDLQKVDSLPCESWDIPLNMIATERHLYIPSKKRP